MRKLLYLFGILLLLSSCTWLNPSIMLKTGKDYHYAKNPDSTKVKDYKLAANDLLNFNLYSNDGFKLIDLTSLNNQSLTSNRVGITLSYLVESDGTVKLPIVGRKKLAGLTVREAEVYLEGEYSMYVKPFVMIEVINRRITVFPGSPGDARVLPLVNNNTTLIEALGLAGGISENGKAKQIKLIRENGENHDVYLIDLSTINGIKQANMVLLANDIIYVEPRRRYASKFLAELAPIVSIVTSAFILYTYSKLVTKK